MFEASGNLQLFTQYFFLVTCRFKNQTILESQEWLGLHSAGTEMQLIDHHLQFVHHRSGEGDRLKDGLAQDYSETDVVP